MGTGASHDLSSVGGCSNRLVRVFLIFACVLSGGGQIVCAQTQTEQQPAPKLHQGRFGELTVAGGVASGSVVLSPAGEKRVIVAGRFRPEIWKIGADNQVLDTGYFVSSEGAESIRVEWESSSADEWPRLVAGVLPWKSTGERFQAFRMSDWLVARNEKVALPFFGRESVGFTFRGAGVLEGTLEDGGKTSGSWWWSRGRLHLRFEGLDEVGTYEWRALAARVGWTEELQATVFAGPSVRPLAVAGGAASSPRSLPRAAAACPRDVLGRLLASATERSDVVSALAIEKETLRLCADRQGLVVEIVNLDRQLESAVEQRKTKTEKKTRRPSLKSVAQLVGVAQKRTPAAGRAEAVSEPALTTAALTAPAVEVTRQEAVPRGIAKAVEVKASYSWFSLLGRRGRLLAGVTDGSRTWFVSVGDVLPRAGVVKRITGRPPGVEVAGLGLLPWTGKPVVDGRGARGGGPGAIGTAEGRTVPGEEVRSAENGALAGKARVIDGDTVEVAGVRVRLWGVDAPEKRQSCRSGGKAWACGGLAEAALRSRSSDLQCQAKGKDRYGRVLGVCFEGREDVNAWLVSEGWALAYRQFSKAYVGQEEEAKAQKRGMHRGEFIAPWDWRRGKRLPEPEVESSEGAGKGSGVGGELPPLPGSDGSR